MTATAAVGSAAAAQEVVKTADQVVAAWAAAA
jgi:hypothetical protein